MKKLNILMLCLFSSLFAAAQGQVSGAVGNHKKDCNGMGLCVVETTKPGLTKMNFKLDMATNVLSFSFNEDDLLANQPEKLSLLRGKTTFIQEEEMELPDALSRQLGSPVPIIIPAGTHQLTYSNGTYTVFVRVSI